MLKVINTCLRVVLVAVLGYFQWAFDLILGKQGKPATLLAFYGCLG